MEEGRDAPKRSSVLPDAKPAWLVVEAPTLGEWTVEAASSRRPLSHWSPDVQTADTVAAAVAAVGVDFAVYLLMEEPNVEEYSAVGAVQDAVVEVEEDAFAGNDPVVPEEADAVEPHIDAEDTAVKGVADFRWDQETSVEEFDQDIDIVHGGWAVLDF